MRTVPVCNLRVGCCGGICAPLAPRAPSPCRRQRPSGWPLPVGPLGARDSARAPRGRVPGSQGRKAAAVRLQATAAPAGVDSEAPPAGMRDGPDGHWHCQWPAGQGHGHGHGHGTTISSIGRRDSEVQVRPGEPGLNAHPRIGRLLRTVHTCGAQACAAQWALFR
jgi:hypothetical protein